MWAAALLQLHLCTSTVLKGRSVRRHARVRVRERSPACASGSMHLSVSAHSAVRLVSPSAAHEGDADVRGCSSMHERSWFAFEPALASLRPQ
eukprot:2725371-Pleurochrysis_carterae.AAC.1